MGSFFQFTKKDPITNIDVKRDDRPKVDIKTEYAFMKDKVPVGTTTHIYKTGKLGEGGKLNRTNILRKDNPKSKTDHISYEPPKSKGDRP